jgi:hypothetical protein
MLVELWLPRSAKPSFSEDWEKLIGNNWLDVDPRTMDHVGCNEMTTTTASNICCRWPLAVKRKIFHLRHHKQILNLISHAAPHLARWSPNLMPNFKTR